MSNYTLDFSLSTDEQRCTAVSQICSQTTFTSKQYTQLADYILLASSERIYPEEFRSPHIVHEEQSLDELMDNPITADITESICVPLNQAKHTPQKRKLDRDNPTYAAIPGMRNLWDSIDSLKTKVDADPANYKLKRTLIDLYKQQYSLLESYLPNWGNAQLPPKFSSYTKDTIPANYKELLCQPSYMARLLIHLPSLLQLSATNMELADFLSPITTAFSLITLTPLQQDILLLYQHQVPTSLALSYIKNKYNRTLTQSYFSIILYKQIAVKVAAEYTELYQAEKYRDDPTKWRTCLCCKQSKLLTKHNWYHFSNKPQGFSLICKECTQAKRKEHRQK